MVNWQQATHDAMLSTVSAGLTEKESLKENGNIKQDEKSNLVARPNVLVL